MSTTDNPIPIATSALGKRAQLMLRVGAPRAAAHADEIGAALWELSHAPTAEITKRLGSIPGVEALAVFGTVPPDQREGVIEQLPLDDTAKLRLATIVHDIGHVGDKQSAAAALAAMFPDVMRQPAESPDLPQLSASDRVEADAEPKLDNEQLANIAAKIATWEPPGEARRLLWKVLPPCWQLGSPFPLEFWKAAAIRVKDDWSPEEGGFVVLLGMLISRLGDNEFAAALYRKIIDRSKNQNLSASARVALARIEQVRGKLDEALRLLDEAEQLTTEDRGRATIAGKRARIFQARGDMDEALRIQQEEVMPVFERLGDRLGRAVTWGEIADILQIHGELNEALRIRQELQMPVFESLGDERSQAVAWGKIADVLQARGEFDEVLRIRREEELPVYERLGDVHSQAVVWGKIADILQDRGDLDMALRIRQEEQMPIFESLGDVRSQAITRGEVAGILRSQGKLEEALRIHQHEVMPAFARLGEPHLLAVESGKIADILQDLGELDESLRIRQEEEMPIYERLGEVFELLKCKRRMARGLRLRKQPGDREWARKLLHEALEPAERMRIPQADEIRQMLDEDV